MRSIRGQVVDFDSGAPIQNAFISSHVSTEVYSSDAEGKFKIQKVGIETSTLIMKVAAENYKSLAQSIELVCQNLNVIVYLPLETNTSNPVFVPDLAPTAACILGTALVGGCKL